MIDKLIADRQERCRGDEMVWTLILVSTGLWAGLVTAHSRTTCVGSLSLLRKDVTLHEITWRGWYLLIVS